MTNRQVVPIIRARPVKFSRAPLPHLSPSSPQAVVRRLDQLEKELRKADQGRRRWRMAGSIGLVVALVAAGVVWATISTVTNNYNGGYGEVNNWDTSKFVVTTGGQLVNALVVAAAGATSGTAIEMALVLGAANTALAAGDWYYAATVKEVGIATVTTGTYSVELLQDGVSMGVLYMKQTTSDALNLEGVTFKWSLGASLPVNAAYTLRVI